jgi:hypothetical protein
MGTGRVLVVGVDPVGEFGTVRTDAQFFEDQGSVVGAVGDAGDV